MNNDFTGKRLPSQNELPGYYSNKPDLSGLMEELKLLEIDASDPDIAAARTSNMLKVLELKLCIIGMQGERDGC